MQEKTDKQDSKIIAYNYIKKMICTCEMAPGSTIQINDIANKLQISKTPVREALLELSYENYVNIVPRKSTSVSKISLQELKDVYDARSVIETFIITNLNAVTNREALLRLKEQWESMDITDTSKEAISQFLHADVHFHLSLVRLYPNAQLVKFCEELIFKSNRFWYMALYNNNMENVKLEHIGILSNLIDNNPAGAVAIAERHISISKALSILSE